MALTPSPGIGSAMTAIAQLAGSVGKPSMGPPGGDPGLKMMGQYGKNPPAQVLGMPGTTGSPSTVSHPGMSQIRGGKGGMKKNPKSGGLGPGKASTPGGHNNYSMQNTDPE